MGGSVSRILSLVWSRKEIRILILGLVCLSNFVQQRRSSHLGQRWQDYTPVPVEGTFQSCCLAAYCQSGSLIDFLDWRSR